MAVLVPTCQGLALAGRPRAMHHGQPLPPSDRCGWQQGRQGSARGQADLQPGTADGAPVRATTKKADSLLRTLGDRRFTPAEVVGKWPTMASLNKHLTELQFLTGLQVSSLEA